MHPHPCSTTYQHWLPIQSLVTCFQTDPSAEEEWWGVFFYMKSQNSWEWAPHLESTLFPTLPMLCLWAQHFPHTCFTGMLNSTCFSDIALHCIRNCHFIQNRSHSTTISIFHPFFLPRVFTLREKILKGENISGLLEDEHFTSYFCSVLKYMLYYKTKPYNFRHYIFITHNVIIHKNIRIRVYTMFNTWVSLIKLITHRLWR